MPVVWEQLLAIAQQEVSGIIRGLPIHLRKQVEELPITFEARPGSEWIEDGVEADSLGLFFGPAFEEEENSASPLPAQILLFLENIWAFAEEDESIYREELRRTYLHELGHYLGLDEEDLGFRDLD